MLSAALEVGSEVHFHVMTEPMKTGGSELLDMGNEAHWLVRLISLMSVTLTADSSIVSPGSTRSIKHIEESYAPFARGGGSVARIRSSR